MATKATSEAVGAETAAVEQSPALPAPSLRKPGFTHGFMDFIRQYHVVPLAIAVVLGNAVNDVVKVLVEGIITPLISLIIPSTALQGYEVNVKHSTFEIGSVINAVVGFIIVAFIVYVFVKKVLHDDSVLEKK